MTNFSSAGQSARTSTGTTTPSATNSTHDTSLHPPLSTIQSDSPPGPHPPPSTPADMRSGYATPIRRPSSSSAGFDPTDLTSSSDLTSSTDASSSPTGHDACVSKSIPDGASTSKKRLRVRTTTRIIIRRRTTERSRRTRPSSKLDQLCRSQLAYLCRRYQCLLRPPGLHYAQPLHRQPKLRGHADALYPPRSCQTSGRITNPTSHQLAVYTGCRLSGTNLSLNRLRLLIY